MMRFHHSTARYDNRRVKVGQFVSFFIPPRMSGFFWSNQKIQINQSERHLAPHTTCGLCATPASGCGGGGGGGGGGYRRKRISGFEAVIISKVW